MKCQGWPGPSLYSQTGVIWSRTWVQQRVDGILLRVGTNPSPKTQAIKPTPLNSETQILNPSSS